MTEYELQKACESIHEKTNPKVVLVAQSAAHVSGTSSSSLSTGSQNVFAGVDTWSAQQQGYELLGYL